MFSSNGTHGDEEEALVFAALQRSPTYNRARMALFQNNVGELALVDVRGIKNVEQKQVLDKLVAMMNGDIEGVFRRISLEFPKVEVRFQNRKVGAFVHVGSRALPTIPNFIYDNDCFLEAAEDNLRKKTEIIYPEQHKRYHMAFKIDFTSGTSKLRKDNLSFGSCGTACTKFADTLFL
ncbi:hypothetical protein OROHE_018027 [Orobanche hederae]